MKVFLFIAVILGAAGAGAHYALSLQDAELGRARESAIKAGAERDAAKAERDAAKPSFEAAKSALAGVAGAPLLREEAESLKALETKLAEAETKLAEAKAEADRAVADAKSAAALAAGDTPATLTDALVAARKRIAELNLEIAKQTKLAAEMRAAITKEETASRGKERYTSTVTR